MWLLKWLILLVCYYDKIKNQDENEAKRWRRHPIVNVIYLVGVPIACHAVECTVDVDGDVAGPGDVDGLPVFVVVEIDIDAVE